MYTAHIYGITDCVERMRHFKLNGGIRQRSNNTKDKYQLIMDIWLRYEDHSNIRLIRNNIVRRSTLIRFGSKPVWLYIAK